MSNTTSSSKKKQARVHSSSAITTTTTTTTSMDESSSNNQHQQQSLVDFSSHPLPLHAALQNEILAPAAILEALRILRPYYALNAQEAKQPRGLTASAWLPSVQSLVKHVLVEDDENKNKNSLVRVLPCDALLDVAQLSLQVGTLLSKQQQQEEEEAQTLFRQGLAVLSKLDEKEKEENADVQTSTASTRRLLNYRLATCARAQGNYRQAKDHALQSLQDYGFDCNHSNDNTKTTTTTAEEARQFVESLVTNTNNSDTNNTNKKKKKKKNHPNHSQWNILSQLFHMCGYASWQTKAYQQARMFFEYELEVKQALYARSDTTTTTSSSKNNPQQPHERIARTLNNLGSVCRDSGDLEAARKFCQQALEMQRALLLLATTTKNSSSSDQDDASSSSSLEMATTLHNLGTISYSLGSFQEAQDFLEKALAMKQTCYRRQQQQQQSIQSQQQSQASSSSSVDTRPTNNTTSTLLHNLDIGETCYNLGMLQDHFSHFDQAQIYYQQALKCQYAVYGKDAQTAELATTLSSLGLSAMNHGEYKEAYLYYQQSLDMQKQVYRTDTNDDDGSTMMGNMETVRTLHGLGILNFHLQRMELSRQYHREALEMQQQIEAQEDQQDDTTTSMDASSRRQQRLTDPRTANLSQVLQSLGNLSHNLGHYEDAREFYEQGLKLYSQQASLAEDVHTTTKDGAPRPSSLDNTLWTDLSSAPGTTDYDAARSFYEKSLQMKYLVYGKEAKNTDLAFTLRSLALLEDNAGRNAQAEDSYQKALEMLYHFYGGKQAQNAEIAAVLDGLGTVKFNQGEYTESRHFLDQSLAMKEAVYGGSEALNGDLATSHVHLGALAHTIGDYGGAMFHLETAFEMQQDVYGEGDDQNIELGVSANCLANLYRDIGEIDKAEELYEMAIAYMGGMEAENPYLASVLSDLGEHYRLLGDYEKAAYFLNLAAALQRKIYGEGAENAEIALTLSNLGKLHLDVERYEEAQKELERALAMQQSVFKDHKPDELGAAAHGDIAETLQAMGNLSRLRGDVESARSPLQQAKQMRENLFGDAKTVEMARTLASLGIVYEETGDQEKAESCRTEVLAMDDVLPVLHQQSTHTTSAKSAATSIGEFLGPNLKETADAPAGKFDAARNQAAAARKVAAATATQLDDVRSDPVNTAEGEGEGEDSEPERDSPVKKEAVSASTIVQASDGTSTIEAEAASSKDKTASDVVSPKSQDSAKSLEAGPAVEKAVNSMGNQAENTSTTNKLGLHNTLGLQEESWDSDDNEEEWVDGAGFDTGDTNVPAAATETGEPHDHPTDKPTPDTPVVASVTVKEAADPMVEQELHEEGEQQCLPTPDDDALHDTQEQVEDRHEKIDGHQDRSTDTNKKEANDVISDVDSQKENAKATVPTSEASRRDDGDETAMDESSRKRAEGDPAMDWSNKKMVRRASQQYLLQKKQKERAAMDWSDKKMVRRASEQYLLRKKQGETQLMERRSSEPILDFDDDDDDNDELSKSETQAKEGQKSKPILDFDNDDNEELQKSKMQEKEGQQSEPILDLEDGNAIPKSEATAEERQEKKPYSDAAETTPTEDVSAAGNSKKEEPSGTPLPDLVPFSKAGSQPLETKATTTTPEAKSSVNVPEENVGRILRKQSAGESTAESPPRSRSEGSARSSNSNNSKKEIAEPSLPKKDRSTASKKSTSRTVDKSKKQKSSSESIPTPTSDTPLTTTITTTTKAAGARSREVAATRTSINKPRGSLIVTDMPPRQSQPVVEVTTCGCWPFGLSK